MSRVSEAQGAAERLSTYLRKVRLGDLLTVAEHGFADTDLHVIQKCLLRMQVQQEEKEQA